MSDAIERLSDASVRALRSAFIITTYVSCIEELVQNAIDASATNISIYLRRDQWSCRVQDNGRGIRPTDLAKLGQRYYTSKAYTHVGLKDVNTFGFRGEALASLAESSVVHIHSRHEDSEPDQTHAIHLRGGEQLSYGSATSDRHMLRAGTVVQVKDLFFKWPVRRKTAASSMETIRRTIELLALLHPQISFTLTDLETPDQKKLLTVNVHASLLDRFRSFFGRSLVQDVKELRQEVLGESRVSGFISFSSAVDKQFQFICVNGRPIQRGPLHRSICEAFDKSNWTSMNESNERHERFSSPHKRQRIQALNPRKGLARHPVFFCHLQIPKSWVDVTVEPSKKTVAIEHEDLIASHLHKLCLQLLRSQGYTVKVPNTRTTMSSIPDTLPFKRTKALKKAYVDLKHSPPIIDQSLSTGTLSEDSQETITWDDPATGLSTVIDARTGNTILRKASHGTGAKSEEVRRTSFGPIDHPHLVSKPNSSDVAPDWIDKALEEWRPNQLEHFPEPSDQQPTIPVFRHGAQESHDCASTTFFHSASFGTLDRQKLSNATVISQVDCKFIVIRDKEALHLVDQHAASERLRVEKYLRQLCSPDEDIDTVSWEEEPGRILISKIQEVTAHNHLKTFRRWGFTLVAPFESEDSVDVEWITFDVTTVPKMVEKRLRQEPHLLQSLITSYLSQLQERSQRSSQRAYGGNWTQFLGDCPQVLLDLVNSKACRGAIMFGDELSLDQCERLIAQLGDTCFPFQCAHGRPSIVPLTPLSSTSLSSGDEKGLLTWNKLQPNA